MLPIGIEDEHRKVKITFDNQIEGLELSAGIGDGVRQHLGNIQRGEQSIVFTVEHEHLSEGIFRVDVEIDQMWSPKEVFGSDDPRILGIAIKNVEIC